jgi:hypothetical protein
MNFIIGSVVFAVAEGLWLFVRPIIDEYSMLVLEPNAGVLLFTALIIIASTFLNYKKPIVCAKRFSEPLSMYAGICFAMSIGMFIISKLGQDSNIWPIALIINYIFIIPIVVFGWFLGILLGSFTQRFIRS